MDDLILEFLTETSDGLAELDVALVHLERRPDSPETLSQIFRLVHTIKATCGFLGLPRLEAMAHSTENVLGGMRDGELALTADLVSLVLRALDRVRAILAGLVAAGAEPDGDDTDLLTALEAAADRRGAGAPAPGTAVFDGAPDAHGSSQPGGQAVSEAGPPACAGASAMQSIRVDVEVLENLVNLVSELVLTRNQLLQLVRGQDGSALAAPLHRLSQITSELQRHVMKTRVQPIGNAWNKLPRLVRNLGRDLGKRIELTMRGQETELDRQVLELIKAPLIHLVRNSGDHGIETPADRLVAGKPETGRITLAAYHEGGHVKIDVADDGRGLSVNRIRAKIIAQGLATEAQLAEMPDEQIQRFIFRPGFSTAAAITPVSGRGVGMDVVKTNIERIGGTVDLRSVEGAGTCFTIKIPSTLAIRATQAERTRGSRNPVSCRRQSRGQPLAYGVAVVEHVWIEGRAQLIPPRAAMGQTHSTRPRRTPTYQSYRSTVGSQCPGTEAELVTKSRGLGARLYQELAVLVRCPGIGHARRLPDERQSGVDGQRLEPGIHHRDPRPRRAHHGAEHEQGVPERFDRCTRSAKIAGVVGVHEYVAARLHLGIHAGTRLERERARSAAADDGAIEPDLTQLLDGAAGRLDRGADQLLPLLRGAPVLCASLVGLQSAEGEVP